MFDENYFVYEFVDELIKESKGNDELFKEYVFGFLTALAINQKFELFIEFQKSWNEVYKTSLGKTAIELAQKLMQKYKEGDENETT